jgi:predicted Fe-Mo cluster-binding NifX family protein
MKIAVSYQANEVFQHFGQSPSFKFYVIEGKTVKSTTIEETNGTGHRDLIPWLKARGVNIVLCGGIGQMAVDLLAEAGIACVGGVMGKADEAVTSYLADTLHPEYTPHCGCHDEKK